MPSLIDKIDSLASAEKHVTAQLNKSTGKIEYTVVPNKRTTQKSKSEKSYSAGYSPFLGYTGANHDLRADEYGAATAATIVTEIQRAVKFWEQWLSGLPAHLYDGQSDKVVWSSTDRKLPSGIGANWAGMLKRFPERWKHDLFESIAFSDWVYGETYIGKFSNRIQVADCMWLNPLAIEPNIQQGKIINYRYQGDEGYYLLPPEQVAYRIAQRNPLDDWRGLSPVLTTIDKINITENVYRSLNGYYRNHMQLGGIVSPDNDVDLTGTSLEELQDDMRRHHRGADNAWRWFFSEYRVRVDTFPVPDIEKNYAIVPQLRKEIAHAMGVPPVLSGDPTEVNYDNADKVMRNWWQTDGIPYARKVAGFINRQLLPALEPNTDIYFGFDFTDYEIEDPETVSTDFTSQIIPINIAQQKRGYEVDEKLSDIYIIGGQPMHRDLIVQKSREGIQDESKDTSTDTTATPSENESGVAVPQSEVFGYHIESGIVDINEARAQLGLPPKKAEETNELQQLQAKLAVMVTAYSAGIPTAISAQMVGLEIPEAPMPPMTLPQSETPVTPVAQIETNFGKSIDIGDDHHAHLEAFEPKHATYDDEFQAWKRFAFKGKSNRQFEPYWLRGDIGDALQDAILLAVGDKDLIAKAFSTAQEQIDTTFKALSATKIDFEEDFNSLIRKAMADNNFGRVQWSSAMRAIIRRYGRRAYADGLIEGGVLDGTLSEEDENEVASLIASQSAYVTNLGAALYRDGSVSEQMALQKPDMWFNRSIKIFYEAGLLSADGNGVYEFAGRDGRESCTTCTHLKGQRHRLKTWARRGLRPGTDADNFECGGWHCEHKLIKVFARERGNWLG